MGSLQLLPPSASAHAADMDWLFAALLGVSAFILLLVFGLMILFCIRYRKGSKVERGNRLGRTWRVEVAWTGLTFAAFLVLYFWGANLYVRIHSPPSDATDIYVVGKQWMWKIEHPGGQREIDTLHVPVGRPVRLVLTSQDVIHDFAIPAFRIRQDAVPGRYETLWFTPTEIGEYRLFCAEFCGTWHARMGGTVVVMEPSDFQRWLDSQDPGPSLAQEGEALFSSYGCSGCHGGASTVHAPKLEGLFGRPVPLEDGRTVIADDRYLRDSILMPKAEIAAGYPPVMPSFAGQIGEDDLLKLVAYIKSLADKTADSAERPAP
ncbi:cytochrome c oxidase subunit II [Azospirillum melinis]|uniref:Cytochrome c oxidase subunit 2 n=1 Tax=Azospirillum melinis TaxID=328839 RepID=A0ABX2K5T5_9PROT|nr:cytochrome c oxidase subunit II [Azospirillum melinis]MBP2306452.1 cytochrome c oxidase subunit 2 [Azospirillum melinis]NUA98190.1 cytochrome c oxidase subunit II [Azospirillum melinis]